MTKRFVSPSYRRRATTVEFHGFVGGDKHFEIYMTKDITSRRPIRLGDTWRLMRCARGAAGGAESFQTAALAMNWANQLNAATTWRRVVVDRPESGR